MSIFSIFRRKQKEEPLPVEAAVAPEAEAQETVEEPEITPVDSEPEVTCEAAPEAETIPAAECEPAGEAGSEPTAETEPEEAVEAAPEAALEPETTIETEPETAIEAAVEPEADIEAAPETAAEAAAEAAVEPEATIEAVPEANVEAEPETAVEPEADSETEIEAANEAEPEAAVEPEAAIETAPEAETAIAVADSVLVADEILDSEPEPHLSDMDFSDFWHDIKESERRYECNKPDQRLIRSVQEELGFALPDAYIELMRKHNGGMLNRCWYPIRFPAEIYSDYIQITHLLGIGREAPYSLCGRFGSEFLLEGKDALSGAGIAFACCISPARALLLLDYRNVQDGGEPCVTFVNSQTGEESVIATNFELFVRGLKTSLEALGQKEN